MELTVKTVDLQDMVGKAIKCVSNNKLIPLTSLMNIKVKDNVFTLTTTDATNYYYVSKEKVACEDFELSVIADTFTKLVQKTTAPDITLIFDNGNLTIKGNGTYNIELPLDETSSIIKFPVKFDESQFRTDLGSVMKSTIDTILATNKASLAVDITLPALTCYYCGDKVVTSDSYKICSTDIKAFAKPLLITSQLMELLGSMSEENISITADDSTIIFSTAFEKIFAPITEGIETFPIDAITGLVESEFKSKCLISKQAVLDVIDRLSLFVSPYDKKGIYLTFARDGVMFSSKKSSGTELVAYVSSDNFVDYTCCIDIEMLKSQILTQDSDQLELYYGSDIAIKLVNKNVTEIIALSEDDRTGETNEG